MTDTAPTVAEAYFLLEWIIRIVMLLVVPFNRSAASTRSWLLLIFFLPAPGLLLFLAIGRPDFPEWRGHRFRELQPVFGELAARLAKLPRQPSATARATAALAMKLGQMPDVSGNGFLLMDDYDKSIDALIQDIDAARDHVRLAVFIFADDPTGAKVIAALARAVARGVRCHVLIDPVGSRHWLGSTLRSLRGAGADAREALPLRWRHGRTRRDMRNHRKLFVIDGAIGYAGSQNIVAKDFKPGIVNRELMARITGPVVAEMSAVFLADWYLETRLLLDRTPTIPASTGTAVLQALPSGADYPLEGFQTLLIWQIHRASACVVIVTPYLIPDEDLLGALRTAVLRGVSVTIIVSAVVDQLLVNLAQTSYYHELLSSGVRIYRFRDELLHAKNVSFDGELAIMGSSNVDIRSFQLNEEISILLFDPASVAALREIQRGYLQRSDELLLEDWRRRGRLRRVAENLARLVSPLL